ncbi:MAG: AraC family transcriptional regulator [Butyricicoccus sp.]
MINRTVFRSKQSGEEVFGQETGNASFRCLYAESESLTGDSFPWHWHTAFEIDFVVGCGVQFDFAGTSLWVPQGNAVFINSGELHSYRPEDPKKCRIYALLFEPVFLAGGYHDAIFPKYITPVLNAKVTALKISPETDGDKAMLANLEEVIQLAANEPLYYELMIRSALENFWCGLLEDLKTIKEECSRPKSRDNDRMKQMLDFIHSNYDHRISLREIAASAMIGTRECSRCFLRSIHRSPMDYVNDYRIQIAIQQLAAGDRNITEIGEMCGFSSVSYFGKVFKQYTGMSPLQYRSSTFQMIK